MSEADSLPRDAAAEELPESLGLIAETVEDTKGTDLLILDLRGLASFTDFMVICSGRSDRHVQAIVDAIVEQLRAAGIKPLHTEGYRQGSWVLVDFVDFLVNVFTPDTRDFYQLERVWRDAPALRGERTKEARPADGAEVPAEDGPDVGAGDE